MFFYAFKITKGTEQIVYIIILSLFQIELCTTFRMEPSAPLSELNAAEPSSNELESEGLESIGGTQGLEFMSTMNFLSSDRPLCYFCCY